MYKQTTYQQVKQITLNNPVLIGKGSFSEVYKITEKGVDYAIKKISKVLIHRQGRQKQLKREVQISKKIKHDNIITFYQCLEDTKFYYMKMQLFPGKNLKKYLLSKEHWDLIRNNRKEANYIATKVCFDYICALAEVRSKMVSNRDIKPDNILIQIKGSQIKTKMIDFGEARFNITDALTQVGTNGYMAPQIYYCSTFYGDQCDMWSLGQTFYEIFQGTRQDSCELQYLASPFKQNFRPKNKQDFDEYYDIDIFQGINLCKGRTPGPFRQIIRQLLHPNPKQRLTFNQMLQILLKRFLQIQDVLRTKKECQYQKNRLIENIGKEKQTLFSRQRLKQSTNKIDLLTKLYKKIYEKNAQSSMKSSKDKKISQANILLITIFLQIQKQIESIQQVMMISAQQLFEEILLKIMEKDWFNETAKYSQQVLKENNDYKYKGLTIQMKSFLSKTFKLEAEDIMNQIKRLFPY